MLCLCLVACFLISDSDRNGRLLDLVAEQLEVENARDRRWFTSLNNGCGAETSETLRTPSAGSGKHNHKVNHRVEMSSQLWIQQMCGSCERS